MKYLKYFEDIEIKDTDKPDVKLAKEQTNDVSQNLLEYNQKKSKIEALYSSTSTNLEIEEGLKKILGEEKDKNPFLSELTKLLRLQKEIFDIQKNKTDDKIKLDDFNSEMSLAKGSDIKQRISFKLKDIKSRLSSYDAQIANKMKELQNFKTEHVKKMEDLKKEIDKNTQSIKQEDQK
jgi:hypothetical protein